MNFGNALKIVTDGFENWKSKPHNAKWFRRIDGTPIPNDLCVCIATEVAHDTDDELRRLWHFVGCPYDHCETCIADAEWIKGLEDRLGPPSALSVEAQHNDR